MMNVIETNESHFQLDSSCDQINPSIFADQPLSSVFDSGINMNGSSLCNDMNGVSENSMGLFDTNQNRLLLKQIRNKNTKDFKELVANFWGPTHNNNNNSLQNQAISRRIPSADAFGDFHPIELASKKTQKNFTNGKPNATMDPLFSANKTMNKNRFRPNHVHSNMDIGSSSANMMLPPMTQSLSSMCNESVVSDDSNHSHQAWRTSATDIINAATNIVNGNEADYILSNNKMRGINMAPPNHKVVAEPGPYDIVCGRNSGAYNFIGNRRFRVTIEMNLQRYIDSPTREDKTKVIKSIVWMLHDQVGARFLKKETCKTVSADGTRRRGAPRYIIMSDKQAREKVGHALRDLVIASRKEQEKMKKKTQQEKEQSQKTASQ